MLLLSGVPVELVSERLGHSQYSTTYNIYSHAVPSMQSKAADAFDEILKRGEVLSPADKILMENKAVQIFDEALK